MSIILTLHCVIWYLIYIHVQHESTRVIICLQSSCIVVQFGTWYTSMSNMNLQESLYCLHVQHKYTRINICLFLKFIISMPNINLRWCHIFLYIISIHVQHKSTRIIHDYKPYASMYYLVFDIIYIHVQHKSTSMNICLDSSCF